MKIISKYKDYYDYLSGIWGEDPKLILDRREFKTKEFYYRPEKITLYICDKIVEGFWDGENFYFGESLSKFGEIKIAHWPSWSHRGEHNGERYVAFDHKDGLNMARFTIYIDPIKDDKSTNKVEKCPILMYHGFFDEKYLRYPVLSKLNVGSVLPPETIYQMLVDWLSERNNEAEKRPDNQTDLQKLVSKGFDKKESFRPNIKV